MNTKLQLPLKSLHSLPSSLNYPFELGYVVSSNSILWIWTYPAYFPLLNNVIWSPTSVYTLNLVNELLFLLDLACGARYNIWGRWWDSFAASFHSDQSFVSLIIFSFAVKLRKARLILQTTATLLKNGWEWVPRFPTSSSYQISTRFLPQIYADLSII